MCVCVSLHNENSDRGVAKKLMSTEKQKEGGDYLSNTLLPSASPWLHTSQTETVSQHVSLRRQRGDTHLHLSCFQALLSPVTQSLFIFLFLSVL